MLFDGKLVREESLKKLKRKFRDISCLLVVIQVGDDFASNKYIAQKEKLAKELGVEFRLIKLNKTTTDELSKLIDELNNDSNVTGIILQLPIPKDIDYEVIRNKIDPNKDIDGVNDVNIVRLINGSSDALIPCTALGIMKILDFYNIDLEGMDVTIIGRSIHIGKALYSLLLNRDCTVTLCHSKTRDLVKHTKDSDMVITSVGKANFITQDMVNDDVILIDVGFNYLDGKICGDVSCDVSKYKYLTPVPGGVGQMTVYSIYENLLKAYELNKKKSKTIIFGTTSERKIEDFKNICKMYEIDCNILSLNDIGWDWGEIEENGETISENSLIKAQAIHEFCVEKGIDYPIITDDAGLFCEALDGEPGVYTARYADDELSLNPDLPKHQCVLKLLKKLNGNNNRNAVYKCCVTCMDKDGNYFQEFGESSGSIAEEVDSELIKPYFYTVFVLDGEDKPFSKLSDDELKNTYRYKALEKTLKKIN